MTKNSIPFWWLPLFLFAAVCRLTAAQLTFDVFAFGLGLDIPGASQFATGWTFVPTADLKVTTISPGPTVDTNVVYEFSIWEGTNQVIASYSIRNRPPYDANGLSHQSIPGLVLKAGSRYGVLLRDPNGAKQGVDYFFRINAGPNRAFTPSPFISEFRNFQVRTNAWIPFPNLISNSDTLILGPSFQFQAIPPAISVSLSADNIVLLSWPALPGVDAYVIQQSTDPKFTNRISLTNTPLYVDGRQQVALAAGAGTAFFRLSSK